MLSGKLNSLAEFECYMVQDSSVSSNIGWQNWHAFHVFSHKVAVFIWVFNTFRNIQAHIFYWQVKCFVVKPCLFARPKNPTNFMRFCLSIGTSPKKIICSFIIGNLLIFIPWFSCHNHFIDLNSFNLWIVVCNFTWDLEFSVSVYFGLWFEPFKLFSKEIFKIVYKKRGTHG